MNIDKCGSCILLQDYSDGIKTLYSCKKNWKCSRAYKDEQELGTIKIEVMTFKQSGKWYETFELEVERSENYYEMIEQVRNIKNNHRQSEMHWLIGHKDIMDYSHPIILKT